jgi:hypothetical protein
MSGPAHGQGATPRFKPGPFRAPDSTPGREYRPTRAPAPMPPTHARALPYGRHPLTPAPLRPRTKERGYPHPETAPDHGSRASRGADTM